jgi:DNA-binding transcriptional LysR family regulator
MELRHLRYFVAVAEAGGVTKAALQLGIQQPPLGQQIRALEHELGVDLFDRAPKRITLNPAGKVFLEDARRILAEVSTMVAHVRRFARGEQGRLAVGFTSSASFHRLIPQLLRKFRETYPNVEIDVEERETYELILALEERRIDAAFLRIGVEGFSNLEGHVLDREPMVAAIPSDHRFASAQHKSLSLKNFAGEPIVVYRRPDGPGIFNGVFMAFEKARVVPKTVDEVHRMVAALNLVAAGRGMTIVPASMSALHPEAIVYRSIPQREILPIPLYFIHRRDADLQLIHNLVATAVAHSAGADK